MTRHYPIDKLAFLALVASGLDVLVAMRSVMLACAPFADAHAGFDGDVLEMAVSYYRAHRVKGGIRSGKTDLRSAVWGKVEIKSACGELPTGNYDTVLYAPIVDYTKPLTEQVFVFTRDEWDAFLSGYTGRGSFLRIDSARGKAHIQSFYGSETVRPKASKPIRAYIDAVCSGQPTLGDF